MDKKLILQLKNHEVYYVKNDTINYFGMSIFQEEPYGTSDDCNPPGRRGASA